MEILLKFFKIIFKGISGGVFSIWTKKNKKTRFFEIGEFEKAAKYAVRQSEGDDVYFSVAALQPGIEEGRGKVTDVIALRCLWADIDIGKVNHKNQNYPETKRIAIEILEKFKFKPSFIIESGYGLHVYFLFKEPFIINNDNDRERLKRISKSFQLYLRSHYKDEGYDIDDTSDLARVLRVPGTKNYKSKTAKDVKIIKKDLNISYSPEEIQAEVEPKIEQSIDRDKFFMSSGTDTISEKKPLVEAMLHKKGCSWMRHCRDDADTLSEKEWFYMLVILSYCENGVKWAHKLSEAYSGYTREETDERLASIKNSEYKPITCEKIKEINPDYCHDCNLCLNSPIKLGYDKDICSAILDRRIIKKAVTVYKKSKNPSEILENREFLIKMLKFKRKNPAFYQKNLKKLKVLKKAIKEKLENVDLVIEMVNETAKKHGYSINNRGELCQEKKSKDGYIDIIPIANFLPIPEKEVKVNDGINEKTTFLISGILNGKERLPNIIVNPEDFHKMNWLCGQWGLKPYVNNGKTSEVRHFIHVMANDAIKQKTIYTHTGWKNNKGEWIYLHADGAIGSCKLDTDLEKFAKNYSFTDKTYEINDAVKTVLSLLEIGNREVMFFLLAFTYLAPLCECARIAQIKEPSFVLWLYGHTGAKKTTLALLFLSHFGIFDRPPASFKDTANSIEKKGFVLKDTLLLIDDYRTSTSRETEGMEATAQTVLRKYGDRIGRGRMKANTESQRNYEPQGIAMITGEDAISGESSSARCVKLEVVCEKIDCEKLTALQNNREKLAYVMKKYIEWLAPQLNKLSSKIARMFSEYRSEHSNEGMHGRFPESIAFLRIGIETFLDFIVDNKCMTFEKAETVKKESAEIFTRFIRAQDITTKDENPATLFVNAIREMITGRIVNIKKISKNGLDDGLQTKYIGYDGGDDYIYLLPHIAQNEVVKFFQAEGKKFIVSTKILYNQMASRGYIEVKKLKNGNVDSVPKKDLHGITRGRYLWLKKEIIEKN